MTRFQIAIITSEGVKTSTEFNGDGYWEGYGQDVYEALKNITTEEEWRAYVTKFNSETFQYEEELHYDVPDTFFDMTTDYYGKWFSDYVYIKNISDESVEFITKSGVTELDENEIGVFNFGTRIVPGTDRDWECENIQSDNGENAVLNKVIDKIRNAEFSVSHECGDQYNFGKYSPAGQDFSFSVEIGNSLSEFAQNVLNYYDDFDVCYETYLWLDSDGHGTNGAPYDMKDLYEDMEACREIIYELYEIIEEAM